MSELKLIQLFVAAPLVGWLPGWLAWRIEKGQGIGIGNLSGAERVFLRILISLFASAGLAIFLAELGVLSLASLLAALILVCVILWRLEIGDWRLGIGDWKGKIQSPIPNLQHQISNIQSLWPAGLLALLTLAGILFFHPAESFLVMDDAGVYVIHGLTLARSGRLAIHDPLLPSLPSTAAQQLLPFVRYESNYIRHEGAFYIWHWGRGLVQPSFFHLPSIWMAVLASLAGPRAAVWATPMAGLVAVAGLALLGRRLFGPAVGLTAALLLTVSLPQVWYARYPTSEMFMQTWLLGGLFLLAVFLRHRSPLLGLAAGVGLGQLLFIRVDAWVVAVVIGLCFAIWFVKDRHARRLPAHEVGDRWFLLPFGLTLGWAAVHAALFASPYVISLMHLYLTPRLAASAILGLAILAAITLTAISRPGILDVPRRSVERFPLQVFSLSHGGVPTPVWLLGALVVGGVLWAGSARFAGDANALRWLNWYFTPLGLIAALAGLALMIRDGVGRPAQVLLLVGLLYALLYLPDPRTRAVQPWAVRRFVPAVLPVLVLAMAYFAVRLPLPASLPGQRALRAVLALALGVLLAKQVPPVLAHREYAGVWDQIEALAGRFEPGAVVLFNRTGVGQAVAQPLTYLYDRPAFVLQSESPDVQVIDHLAEQWSADGRPVYLAITGLAPWLAGLHVEPAGDFTLRFPRLERPTDHAPQGVETQKWQIDLYRVLPEGHQAAVSRLEMESGELPYLQAGFYNRETSPDGTTFRWTDGDGRLRLPVSPAVRHLALRVSGPPARVPRPGLTLLIDGRKIGTWKLPEQFVTLNVDLPTDAAADGWLDIELRSDTWVPQEAGLGDDGRRLGVVLDWIAVSVTTSDQ